MEAHDALAQGIQMWHPPLCPCRTGKLLWNKYSFALGAFPGSMFYHIRVHEGLSRAHGGEGALSFRGTRVSDQLQSRVSVLASCRENN